MAVCEVGVQEEIRLETGVALAGYSLNGRVGIRVVGAGVGVAWVERGWRCWGEGFVWVGEGEAGGVVEKSDMVEGRLGMGPGVTERKEEREEDGQEKTEERDKKDK